MVHEIITVFLEKVSDFIDGNLFIVLAIFRIYMIILGKQLNKKWSYIDEKIAQKNGDNK